MGVSLIASDIIRYLLLALTVDFVRFATHQISLDIYFLSYRQIFASPDRISFD
jgi:hypothetical protein